MIADFFTKPLQGALFTKFRDIIMGVTHFSTLAVPGPVEPRSVLENEFSDKASPGPDMSQVVKLNLLITQEGGHGTNRLTVAIPPQTTYKLN
jgi:hypothetical protein